MFCKNRPILLLKSEKTTEAQGRNCQTKWRRSLICDGRCTYGSFVKTECRVWSSSLRVSQTVLFWVQVYAHLRQTQLKFNHSCLAVIASWITPKVELSHFFLMQKASNCIQAPPIFTQASRDRPCTWCIRIGLKNSWDGPRGASCLLHNGWLDGTREDYWLICWLQQNSSKFDWDFWDFKRKSTPKQTTEEAASKYS